MEVAGQWDRGGTGSCGSEPESRDDGALGPGPVATTPAKVMVTACYRIDITSLAVADEAKRAQKWRC